MLFVPTSPFIFMVMSDSRIENVRLRLRLLEDDVVGNRTLSIESYGYGDRSPAGLHGTLVDLSSGYSLYAKLSNHPSMPYLLQSR